MEKRILDPLEKLGRLSKLLSVELELAEGKKSRRERIFIFFRVLLTKLDYLPKVSLGSRVILHVLTQFCHAKKTVNSQKKQHLDAGFIQWLRSTVVVNQLLGGLKVVQSFLN